MAKTEQQKSSTAAAKPAAVKMIAENRKARFDYTIEDTYEAGLVLTGSEVKSLRRGDVNLKDSYVVFVDGEPYLQNAHISVYKASSYMNHAPERKRKLLLKKSEKDRLERAIEEKGLSCIPLKLYFKGSWAKIEVAVARGKKAADKRESLKSKEAERELAAVKRKNR